MRVPTAVDGAVIDTHASGATSEARAATGASHVIEAVIEAEIEIKVKTVVSRAWTDRISTIPDQRRARPG